MRLWIKDPLAILAPDAERGIVVDGSRIVECVPRGQTPVATLGRDLRRLAPRRPARSDQRAPPLLPDADPRPPGRLRARTSSHGSWRWSASGTA